MSMVVGIGLMMMSVRLRRIRERMGGMVSGGGKATVMVSRSEGPRSIQSWQTWPPAQPVQQVQPASQPASGTRPPSQVYRQSRPPPSSIPSAAPTYHATVNEPSCLSRTRTAWVEAPSWLDTELRLLGGER